MRSPSASCRAVFVILFTSFPALDAAKLFSFHSGSQKNTQHHATLKTQLPKPNGTVLKIERKNAGNEMKKFFGKTARLRGRHSSH
jgi:hypothetical protein